MDCGGQRMADYRDETGFTQLTCECLPQEEKTTGTGGQLLAR
jgi:hypothetical protein